MNGKKKFALGGVAAGLVAGAIIAVVALQGSGEPAPSPATATPPAWLPTQAPEKPESVISWDGVLQGVSAEEIGMVSEPVTQDIEVYADALFRAFATYDTTKATRSEFLSYLKTWLTRDITLAPGDEQEGSLRSQRSALSQRVDGDQIWDGLASTRGTSVVKVTSPIVHAPDWSDPSGKLQRADAEVTVTYTQHDGGSEPAVFEVKRELAALILCGADIDPAPGSKQKDGDCKAVRLWVMP